MAWYQQGGGGESSIDWGLFLAKGILLAPTTDTIDDSFSRIHNTYDILERMCENVI